MLRTHRDPGGSHAGAGATMKLLVAALLLGAGLVNLVPVLGVLSSGRLHALYGVSTSDPNQEILLRHRAVLFAIVGALLVAAAFDPSWRRAAIAAGLVSMLSFVAIALLVGDYNPLLRRVVIVDVVASAGLVLAAVLDARGSSVASRLVD